MSRDYDKIVKLDTPWIQPYWGLLQTAGNQYGIDPAILAGIMSRESGGGRLLSPQGPVGKGDGGHGHGLMQFDDRYWKDWLNNNAWYQPAVIIYKAAALLKSDLEYMQKKNLNILDAWKCAISAYNAGAGGAYNAWSTYRDSDRATTGRDYAADVQMRSVKLRAALQGPANTGASGNVLTALVLGLILSQIV